MKPLKRKPVSKGKSARRFKKNTQQTKSPNLQKTPMRGGWRL